MLQLLQRPRVQITAYAPEVHISALVELRQSRGTVPCGRESVRTYVPESLENTRKRERERERERERRTLGQKPVPHIQSSMHEIRLGPVSPPHKRREVRRREKP